MANVLSVNLVFVVAARSTLQSTPARGTGWGVTSLEVPYVRSCHYRPASRRPDLGDWIGRRESSQFSLLVIRMLSADLLLWLGGLIVIVPVLALVRPVKTNPYYV